MAYRPSRRQTRRAPEALEPNMAPIMNLMVVLIPLLLSSVQLIKMSMIELNLPPATNKEALPALTEKKSKKEAKLELAVTITDYGFYVSGPSSVLKSKENKLVIPKKDGNFDYSQLAEHLFAIKGRLKDQYQKTEAITIQAEPQIDYQTLVSTMDAARSIRVDGKNVTLFPKASMSALML